MRCLSATAELFVLDCPMQIRIDGTVEKLSEDEAVTYFHSRPRESQFSACVSNQSNVVASREVSRPLGPVEYAHFYHRNFFLATN